MAGSGLVAGAAPPLIAIADYGMGNRRSVEKALERVGARVVITDGPEALHGADGIILPGVGAFPPAMVSLRQHGLADELLSCVDEGIPLLGLCLGMQLLFDHSEEHGGADGLGLLGGIVKPLVAQGLKLPHIGWNEVTWTRASSLSDGLPDPASFYHVHSFAAHCADPGDVLGTSDYGSVFPSVVGRGNVFGAQFHPEKSSANGLGLLSNFTALCARTPA
jgi:imidazole glycerol-phosphate synthase subunit HisH